MTINASDVRRLIERMSSLASEEDEWLTLGERLPAALIAPRLSSARRWLYLTKLHWLRGLDAVPDDVGLVQSLGLATPGLADVLRALIGGGPLWFVGDLDPLDITIYLSLRAESVDVRYLGIGVDWLEICAAGATNSLPTIPLSSFEQENFRALEIFDLPALIGEVPNALLSSGHKLELEGAFNESFYGDGHASKIRALLFDT